MQQQLNRLAFIDVWRAIAVLAVLVGHLDRNEPFRAVIESFSLQLIFGWASLGVFVFFFISGYVVCLAGIKDIENGRFSIRGFYIKRLFRIMPPLLVYGFTCMMLGNWGFKLIPFSPREFLAIISYTCNLEIEIFHCGWFGGHTWSLAFEEQFYILFPLALFFKNIRIRIFSPKGFLIAFTLVVFLAPLFFPKPWVGESGFFLIHGLFLTGALCAKYQSKLSQILHQASEVYFVTALTVTVLLYKFGNPYLQLGLVFSIPIMVLCSGYSGPINVIFFRSTALAYLGKISYSIYLWQQLVTSNQFYVPNFLGQLAAIGLLFLLCAFSYEVFERRLIGIGNRLAQQSKGSLTTSRFT